MDEEYPQSMLKNKLEGAAQHVINHQLTKGEPPALRIEQIEGNYPNQITGHTQGQAKFKAIAGPDLEISARLAHDKAVANKSKLIKQRNCFNAVVLFESILQDYPELVAQSIKYFTTLAQKSHQLTNSTKLLSKDSIKLYFSKPLEKYTYNTFFELTSELLNKRLLEISQELQKSLNLSQMNVKVEIISLFLKTVLEFQQYLPPEDYSHNSNIWHIQLQFLYPLFNINRVQYSKIKRLFLEHNPRLIYLPNESEIHELVTTCYLLQLKHKFNNLNMQKYKDYPSQQFKAEFKKRKQKAIQMSKSQMNVKEVRLSELYKKRRTKKSHRILSTQELKQTLEIFQELLSTNQRVSSKNNPRFLLLAKKYQSDELSYYQTYRYYSVKRKRFLKKYSGDLSGLKDQIITKLLIRNPNVNYEEVLRYSNRRYSLYIEQAYFDSNIQRLLTKEAQYQQLRYMEKVLKEIDERKEGKSVIFVDSCRLTDEKESNVIVTVTLAGTLVCKKSKGNMHFLKEVTQLLKNFNPAIVVLFNDQFPILDEIEDEVLVLRKVHTLLFLPHVALAPNPCSVIANSLGTILRERLSKQCDWETILQDGVQELSKLKVKEIVQKEWEKVQQPMYQISDYHNQEEGEKSERSGLADFSMEGDSDSNPMEEKEDDEMSKREKSDYNPMKEKDDDEINKREKSSEGFPLTHFPRGQDKDGESLSTSPSYSTMENLQTCSANQLSLFLTKFRQLNTRNLFFKAPTPNRSI